jgi:hypothetical protein
LFLDPFGTFHVGLPWPCLYSCMTFCFATRSVVKFVSPLESLCLGSIWHGHLAFICFFSTMVSTLPPTGGSTRHWQSRTCFSWFLSDDREEFRAWNIFLLHKCLYWCCL